ncbi:unnamed protein product [Penicillium olsonii]|nr:unnamed protein product [Penicillium olsonii]
MGDKSSPRPSRCIAVIGATGQTGRLVLRNLFAIEGMDLTFQIYVRSQSKLESLFPAISSDDRVTVFQGSIDDHSLMARCLSGVDTIICTLGENENIPGVRVMQDFAKSTLKALEILKERDHDRKPPRLILLSSATWNERLSEPRPAILHWMIRNAFARPYQDLVNAQELLKASPSLLSMILVQPNALVEEAPSGCVIDPEFAYMAVSYEDLAEGFLRLVTDRTYDGLDAVGVSSKNAKNELLYIPFVLGKVIRGLMFQFIPGYWQTEFAVKGFLGEVFSRKKKQS